MFLSFLVKNQGKWVIHFINEMQRLCQETGDKNINVIIVDFNSTDIDVEKELENANLPRYRFVQRYFFILAI